MNMKEVSITTSDTDTVIVFHCSATFISGSKHPRQMSPTSADKDCKRSALSANSLDQEHDVSLRTTNTINATALCDDGQHVEKKLSSFLSTLWISYNSYYGPSIDNRVYSENHSCRSQDLDHTRDNVNTSYQKPSEMSESYNYQLLEKLSVVDANLSVSLSTFSHSVIHDYGARTLLDGITLIMELGIHTDHSFLPVKLWSFTSSALSSPEWKQAQIHPATCTLLLSLNSLPVWLKTLFVGGHFVENGPPIQASSICSVSRCTETGPSNPNELALLHGTSPTSKVTVTSCETFGSADAIADSEVKNFLISGEMPDTDYDILDIADSKQELVSNESHENPVVQPTVLVLSSSCLHNFG